VVGEDAINILSRRAISDIVAKVAVLKLGEYKTGITSASAVYGRER